ncbi:hypothetical protein EJD97_003369 [Solanum chilense]|uniref:Uncharacterized protein n=1 Tax=Solanum chilense TaxID=4083 RepID=A0A6N2AKX8_SOLCI|nr:hypothetical protein EJD97_003369 [Solanum chilense]
MEGHLHQQQSKDNQKQHNMSGIFSQVNYTSGGMYTFVAQPCEDVNIDTNGGDKLFGKWIPVQPTDSLMIEDQHRLKSQQDVNIDTGGGDKVFLQWTVVKPSDFLMNQNQHRFMNNKGVNMDTGGGDRVFAQQRVVDPYELFAQWSAFIKDQPYDQHQLMIHQGGNINTRTTLGVRTNTNGGDRLFPQRTCVDKSYLSMTQGSAQELLPHQNDLDALMTQD